MEATLNLYDESGRLIQSGKQLIHEARNQIAFHIKGVAEGLYFLHLKNSRFSKLERIVIID